MTYGEKMCFMRELYENGSSIKAIAEATGYKESTVNQILSKCGIKRAKRLSDDSERLIRLRKEGKSLKEINHITGWNITSLSLFFSKCGLGKNNTIVSDMGDTDLIDENTIFADEREIKFERIFVDGKSYIDVTEAFI